MTDLEFKILDVLYFPETLEAIVEETGLSQNLVRAELKRLVSKGWVSAMRYSESAQDWVPTPIYDVEEGYKYLATREGLMRHAGR
jgi:transcription initiation factor IIE alpha subunit